MSAKDAPFSMDGSGKIRPELQVLLDYHYKKKYLETLNRKQKMEMGDILNSEYVPSIIKLAGQAVEKPKINFKLNYSEGLEMLLPHLKYLLCLSRLLAAKAWQSANNGKAEEAINLCIIGLKLTRQLQDEPLFISQLLYYRCNVTILVRLEKIFKTHGISDAQIAERKSILESQNILTAMQNTAKTERVLVLRTIFEPVFNGRIPRTAPQEYKKLGFFGRKIIFLAAQWGCICYLEIMKKYIASYNDPCWGMPYSTREIENWRDSLPSYGFIARIVMPPLGQCRCKTAQTRANIGKTLVSLEIERYKKRNGRLPKSLSDLDKKLPEDPFSGIDFQYQKQGKSYKLMSDYDVDYPESQQNGLPVEE